MQQTLELETLLIGPKRQMKLALRQAYQPVLGEIVNKRKADRF